MKPKPASYQLAKEEWLKAILRTRKLSPFQKLVGAVLFLHANKDHFDATGEIHSWPSQALIAKRLRATEQGAYAAIRKLRHHGYVALVESGKGRTHSNRYQLILPTGKPKQIHKGFTSGVRVENPNSGRRKTLTAEKENPNELIRNKRSKRFKQVRSASLAPLRPGGAAGASLARAPEKVPDYGDSIWSLIVADERLKQLAHLSAKKLFRRPRYEQVYEDVEKVVGEKHQRLLAALLLTNLDLNEAEAVAHKARALKNKKEAIHLMVRKVVRSINETPLAWSNESDDDWSDEDIVEDLKDGLEEELEGK